MRCPFLVTCVYLCTVLLIVNLTVWLVFAGLHDQGVESEFQWSDGTVVQFTNWDAWQPDDWRNYEDCAHVRQYNDGRWNDQRCLNYLPYICKRPKGWYSKVNALNM